jgi:plastocyanin
VLAATVPLTVHAAPPAAKNARVHTVTIEAMRFTPQSLRVRRGDRITWINKDPFPHTVTATGGTFDSHPIAPGASWTYVAAKTGEYDYVCTLHVDMKGRLEVR